MSASAEVSAPVEPGDGRPERSRPVPRPVTELDPFMSAESAGLPELDEAWRRSRSAATNRLSWLLGSAELFANNVRRGTLPAGLGWSDDVDADLVSGVDEGSPEIVLHVPLNADELSPSHGIHRSVLHGEHRAAVPDQRAARAAIRGGGLARTHVERRVQAIADVVDDLSTSLCAPVSAVVVSGRVPRGSSLLQECNRVVVLALSGSARVEHLSSDGVHMTEIAEGEWCDVPAPTGAATDPAGSMVILTVRMMEVADAWRTAGHKAGFWPRLRADLPLDPAESASLYGESTPRDLRSLLREELSKLVDDGTAGDALAAWRMNLVPARAAAFRTTEPDVGDDVMGRFPGGVVVQRATADDEVPLVATCGWVLPMDRSGVAVLARLAGGDSVPWQRSSRLLTDLWHCGLVGAGPDPNRIRTD